MPDDIIEREVLGEASRACGALVDRVRRGSPERAERPLANSANTPQKPFRHTLKRFSGH